jgi:hypothetical protein
VTAWVSQSVAAADVAACLADLDVAIGKVFGGLRSMAMAMENAWADGSGPMTPDDVTAFQGDIFAQLDAHRVVDSAGYVMCEHALSGVRRHLEWWNRGAAAPSATGPGTYEPLILNVEPGTADCYDYYAKEWFHVATGEQRRCIAGPLIDLACADVCVMTFSDPVVVAGPGGAPLVLGVAAADVALSRFESMLLPPLRRIAAPAVLVNSQRRVITSNDATWISGEKLPAVPAPGDADWQAVVPVTGDGLDVGGWTLAIRR